MFENRQEAGKKLSVKLKEYDNCSSCLVVAIPRGGVILGAEIAHNLHLPLECIILKKLGAPYNPELAIGAVAQGDIKFIDWEMVQRNGVTGDYLAGETEKKQREVNERVREYGVRQELFNEYKSFILTDDGIATGATARAAIAFLRQIKPSNGGKPEIILAVAVAQKEIAENLAQEADKTVILERAGDLGSVGAYYREFGQVDDLQVIKILNKYRRKQ